MKTVRVRYATLALAVALLHGGCASHPADKGTATATAEGAPWGRRGAPSEVIVHSWGGIASMNVLRAVTRGAPTRYDGYSRRTCGAACDAPTDTLGGTLTDAQAERIWRSLRLARLDTLRADYGTSPRGADLMLHEIAVTDAAGKRAFVGDDVTLPPALRAVMDTVNAVIGEARGGR